MPSPRKLHAGICKHFKSEYQGTLSSNSLEMLFWCNTEPTASSFRFADYSCLLGSTVFPSAVGALWWDLISFHRKSQKEGVGKVFHISVPYISVPELQFQLLWTREPPGRAKDFQSGESDPNKHHNLLLFDRQNPQQTKSQQEKCTFSTCAIFLK